MSKSLLSPQLLEIRDQAEVLVADLHSLAVDIQKPELIEKLDEMRQHIREPFLFVICGEVKAGKSSFINALLATGREIAKVAPQPMTDSVQEILYGPEEQHVVVSEHFKKIYLPVDILQEIAIVDTPGTNTIVENHQEITERFVPHSDLVVFVFEAKNPYRQSAWSFFDFIHEEWRRKVIFVLQQKDLLPAEDLQVNIDGVTHYAKGKGIDSPLVFAVSAMDEQQGREGQSGFAELKSWIREHITGGKAAALKLSNTLDSAAQFIDRISLGLDERKTLLNADIAFRAQVDQTLEKQSQQSKRHVAVFTENIVNAYSKISRKHEEELASGLGLPAMIRRAFAGLFSSDAGTEKWLDQFVKNLQADLSRDLGQRVRDGIGDLAEHLQQTAQLVSLLIEQNKLRFPGEQLYFSDVQERRKMILFELDEAFRRFVNDSSDLDGADLFSGREKIAGQLLTGGGLAVVGIMLTALSNLAVFDITGGVITALGLVFVGITGSVKRKNFLKAYREEMDRGRIMLEVEVESKLNAYTEAISQRILQHFQPLDQHLEREKEAIEHLNRVIDSIHRRQEELSTRLKAASV